MGLFDDFYALGGPQVKPNSGRVGDLWTSLKRGVEEIPGMVTGLADIPFALTMNDRPITRGAEIAGEATGFQPGKWAKAAEQNYSPNYQQSQQDIQQTWDDPNASGWDVAAQYAKNPGYVLNQTIESLPSMIAGGVGSRALMGAGRAAQLGLPGMMERGLGKWAAPVAAGIGEGGVTAGQQMEGYAGPDQRRNALGALGAGLTTGAIGVGAGRVANRFGLETAETAMAGGKRDLLSAADAPFMQRTMTRRILGGGANEALLQEVPQSGTEQMWQNYGEGAPLMGGVGRAAVEGGLAGGLMGAAFNIRRSHTAPSKPTDLLRLGLDPSVRDPNDMISFSDGSTMLRSEYEAIYGDKSKTSTQGPGAPVDMQLQTALGIQMDLGNLSLEDAVKMGYVQPGNAGLQQAARAATGLAPQDTINGMLGIGQRYADPKTYPAQFNAAADARTGQQIGDMANGQVEYNDTDLEAVQRRAGILEQERQAAVKEAEAVAAAKQKHAENRARVEALLLVPDQTGKIFPKDAKGKNVISDQLLTLQANMEKLRDAKALTPEQYTDFMGKIQHDLQAGTKDAISAVKSEVNKLIVEQGKPAVAKEKASVAKTTETKQAKPQEQKAAPAAVAPNGTKNVPAQQPVASSVAGSNNAQGSVGSGGPVAAVADTNSANATGTGTGNGAPGTAAATTPAAPAPVVKKSRVVPKGTFTEIKKDTPVSDIAAAPKDALDLAMEAVREKRRKRAENDAALAKGEAIPHPDVHQNLNAGPLNSEDLQDMIVAATWHIRNGARAFGAYTKAMVSDFGEAVVPHLRRIHTMVHDELKTKRVDVALDKHSQDKAPMVSFSSNAQGQDTGFTARMAKGPHAVATYSNGSWVLDPEKSGLTGATPHVLGTSREEALHELPYAVARAQAEVKAAEKASSKTNPSGKRAVKFQPSESAVVGGRVDVEALNRATSHNPAMQKAVRYSLGLDDDGTRMVDDEVLTDQAAAEMAGIGKNSAAAVSDARKKLGISKYMAQRFMQSSETAPPIDGYVADNAHEEEAMSYIDAMMDAAEEDEKTEAFLAEQRGGVEGIQTSDQGKDEQDNERIQSDNEIRGLNTASSIGGSAGSVDAERNGSIARAKFYSHIKSKGVANVDLHELLTAYTLGARYVIEAADAASSVVKRNAAENQAILKSLSAEIEKRYASDRAATIQAEQTLRRTLQKRGLMQQNTNPEEGITYADETNTEDGGPISDGHGSEDGGIDEAGTDGGRSHQRDEGLDAESYVPAYESINGKDEVALPTLSEIAAALRDKYPALAKVFRRSDVGEMLALMDEQNQIDPNRDDPLYWNKQLAGQGTDKALGGQITTYGKVSVAYAKTPRDILNLRLSKDQLAEANDAYGYIAEMVRRFMEDAGVHYETQPETPEGVVYHADAMAIPTFAKKYNAWEQRRERMHQKATAAARVFAEQYGLDPRAFDQMGLQYNEGDDAAWAFLHALSGARQLLSTQPESLTEANQILNKLRAQHDEIDARPGANVVRMAKLLGPKLYGSPENLTTVSVKELFQNSFDAIKALIDSGKQKSGHIKLDLDETNRTITLTDNGSGMSPQVLANQFLQIAGTHKETERASGGLGIAKMLFLYGNESLRVTTLRDGKVAVLDTSGDELMKSLEGGSAPRIAINSATNETRKLFPDGHGTIIQIKVPKTFVDPGTGETKDIGFSTYKSDYDVLAKSPLFSDIKVEFNGSELPIGAGFPSDKFTQFANVKFDWGTARIYVTKAIDNNVSWSGNTNILSNGLWQFSTKITDGSGGWNAKQVPRTFFVDIDSKVRPEDAGYPFDLNRQQFSKTTALDVDKIFRYITALYRNDSLSNQAQDFGAVEYLDRRGNGTVSSTSSKRLAPPIDKNAGPAAAINEGDTVTVHEGRLTVNGRPIPELNLDDLKNTSIDLDKVKIDQSEIDSARVMLHDNLLVIDSDVGSHLAALGVEYKALEDQLYGDNNETDGEKRRKLRDRRDDIETEIEDAKKERANAPKIPITEAARAEFGARFDEYAFGIGDAFRQLRDVVADIMGYDALKNEGIGVSFDKEYRGVSIKLPFAGMFLNPAVPEYTDVKRAAFGMYGTMVHELAHFKERSHDAGFAAEMQRLHIALAAQDQFDVQAFQKQLVDLVEKHHDVLLWLNERNRNEDSTARGRRFKDGSQQTIPRNTGGNMAGPGALGEGASGVSGRTKQSTSANQARPQSGGSGGGGSTSGRVNNSAIPEPARRANTEYANAAERIRATMPVKAKDAFATITDRFQKLTPWLLTNHQLLEQYGSKLKSLGSYIGLTQAMTKAANDASAEFHKVLVRWDAFKSANPAMNKLLENLMLRATMAEIHPDIAFNDPLNRHLDATKQAEYDKLHAQYSALVPEAKKLYQDVKAQLKTDWDNRRAAYATLVDKMMANRMVSAMGDQAQEAKIRKDIADAIETYDKTIRDMKGPYFPLARFGEFLAIGESADLKALKDKLDNATGDERRALEKQLLVMRKDPKHYQVSSHETKGQQNAALRAMDAAGLETRREMTDQQIDGMRVGSQQALTNIMEVVDTQFSDDKGTANSLNSAITSMFLRSLPEMHALRREAARQGIEGASPDMMRAFAAAGQKGSFYNARMQYAGDLTSAMFKMKSEAKGDTKMMHIFREMEQRMYLDMKKQNTPVQDILSSASWLYHIGVSPSFMLINSTQPWLVSGPVLAGRHGFVASTKALTSATQSALKILKDARWKDGKWDGWAGISKDSLTDTQERTMLRELMARGIVDEGQQNDSALFASGTNDWRAKAARWTGWTTQQIELVNRTATALAAYRLEMQKSGNYDTAVEYAYQTTVNTQFDYSASGKARVMREGGGVPLAKLIFQFRSYQQGLLYLLGDNIKKLTNPDEQKQAAATLGYLVLSSGMAAGALGLPFMSAVLWGLDKFIPDDDPEGDAETRLRNYLFHLTGDRATANVMAKGVPAMFGADLSQRIGLGDVASPFQFMRLDKATTGKAKLGEVATNVLGPAAGLGAQFWDAYTRFSEGDLAKGAEKMTPKAIADVVKAARYATEGFTDGKGSLTGTELNGWEIALKALGVTSPTESGYYEGTTAIKDVTAAIKQREGNIGRHYQEALRTGDMGHVRDLIQTFNSDHPENKITGKKEQEWRRAAREAGKDRTAGTGVKLGTKTQAAYNHLADFAR